MVNSIRVRLLAWYAAILLMLICALGVLLYVNVRRSIYAEIDAELRAQALALAANLAPRPDGSFDLELSEEHVQHFQQEAAAGAPFYVIWGDGGEIVDRSDPRLDVARPGEPGAATRGGRREVAVGGPRGSVVVVGQGVLGMQRRLRDILWGTVALGAGAMAIAMAGGWFLVSRALRPIERISRTARSVSASNLSQRIDLKQVEGELGDLARTLNEAFDRLQGAFEQQTRFTADASHELRTPLSIVLSSCELALKRPRSEEEYRGTLEATLKAARRMKSVVEALLTLARADGRQVRLEEATVQLDEAIREAAGTLAPLAAERRVSVTTDLSPVQVVGDRGLLHEMVVNLVKNAIYYNREGGEVSLGLKAAEGAATLSVADTGIGIPEGEQARVFERFFRVDKARSREQGGTGLGLAITRWIVQLHGGRITFESREGVGTTFTVTLPLRTTAAGAETSRPQRSGLSDGGAR